MRKKSKISTIKDSWIKAVKNIQADDYISSEEVDSRRSKCLSCNYCSKNVSQDRLKLLENIYGKVVGDYCTICACPIGKKVIAPEEECALGQKGKSPLWNRMVVLTTAKNGIRLVNKSPRKINIDLIDNCYTIVVGNISDDMEFEFDIETPQVISELGYVNAKCPCIKVISQDISENRIKIKLRIVSKYLPGDLFNKWVYVKYKNYSPDDRRFGVKIIGKKL